MHTPSQDDELMENWKKCTVPQKAVVIKAFLDECGEDATWEQWLAFLHRYQDVKGFEWTKLVNSLLLRRRNLLFQSKTL